MAHVRGQGAGGLAHAERLWHSWPLDDPGCATRTRREQRTNSWMAAVSEKIRISSIFNAFGQDTTGDCGSGLIWHLESRRYCILMSHETGLCRNAYM